MNEEKLPPWPKADGYCSGCNDPVCNGPQAYERARAEAALARLRVAVEALKQYAAYPRIGLNASQALAAIGDLP